MTLVGDNVVSFKRPLVLRIVASAARDLAKYPRLARALGIVPPPPQPAKPPVALQDLGEHPPRH